MRHLNCVKCSEGKEAGVRMLYAQSGPDPAEYERVTWGIAKQPTQQQRTVVINGEPILMDTVAFNCDCCNAQIKPGDRCYGWTVWLGGQREPQLWESEFLEPEKPVERKSLHAAIEVEDDTPF